MYKKESSMITSLQNNQVKNIIKLNQKAKARREQGLFIAEGRKMFLEAPLHWIEKVYVSETVEKQDTEVMEKASRTEWEAVTDSVFRQMSDTQTPQGVMTVLRKPSYEPEDILKGRICRIREMREPFSVQRRALAWMVFFLQKPVWILQIPK